jgi:hypothetical protein
MYTTVMIRLLYIYIYIYKLKKWFVTKSLVNTSMNSVIACCIVGTFSSRRNLNPLSWNKAIRDIFIDLDLMGMIIVKLGLECFGGIY